MSLIEFKGQFKYVIQSVSLFLILPLNILTSSKYSGMANGTNQLRSMIRLLSGGASAFSNYIPVDGVEMLLDQVTPQTVSCLFKVSFIQLFCLIVDISGFV